MRIGEKISLRATRQYWQKKTDQSQVSFFKNMLYERQVSYCMHYSPQFYENRPIKDASCTARKIICRTGLKEVENESVKEFWERSVTEI